AEDLLVASNGELQRAEEAFGGVEVEDDPLVDDDRLARRAHRLRVEAEIDDQLLRRAGNAAEVGVEAQRLRVIDFDGGALLLLRSGTRRLLLGGPAFAFFAFFGHA